VYTGIGIYTLYLYSALAGLLQDGVKLVTWNGELIERLYSNVRRHGRQKLEHFEEILRFLNQSIFMMRLPRKYTLYHITNPSLSLLTRRLRPCIVTVHDIIPFTSPRPPFWADYLIKKSMENIRFANRIICVSNSTKELLLGFLDIDPNLVRVVHNGLDHDLFKPRSKKLSRRMLGLSDENVLILHVGTEEERKSIPTLIKTFHKMQKEMPNAILLRVGEKSPHIQRLIKSLGLTRKIIYMGYIKDLAILYNAADMLVFPSYHEGFGLPLLEAMASGCPIIASNTTSIPEVVGNAGILLDPFDIDGFSYWMREVYTNETLRKRLIDRGITRSRDFSWTKCADENLEVYRQVIRE